ncbi:MAG: fructose-6-phosphate aldolase [Proteobacteria bacterium]|nr:fructose-6-phosphate aldolase [Pseudomonadota bacterium]MBU4277932.1 fructose-6-phosphate aldolase [Pseudomonadota bacterium]MBU4384978.1 fructose-6-phosphate aldolase [Pseudomonadota bacterium]MCG2766113.1 fructose-6-phosphate aldolase [Desulfarculaceae bacterium]
MKIFIDTADLGEIKEAMSLGILDGVTTNPSLVAKTGKPFEACIKDILEVVPGDVSVEVVGTDHDTMVQEGKKYAAWGDNVVIKVPIIQEGLKAIKTLSQEGIKVNVTLCFSPLQALLAAKAGASYISPFVGRLDDIGSDGMDLIQQIVDIYGNYAYDTEVLVASIRNPMHVVSAALMGADVCTIPFKVIGQLLKHPLTDKGLAAFLADWEKANKG